MACALCVVQEADEAREQERQQVYDSPRHKFLCEKMMKWLDLTALPDYVEGPNGFHATKKFKEWMDQGGAHGDGGTMTNGTRYCPGAHTVPALATAQGSHSACTPYCIVHSSPLTAVHCVLPNMVQVLPNSG